MHPAAAIGTKHHRETFPGDESHLGGGYVDNGQIHRTLAPGIAFDPDFQRDVEVGAGFGLRWRSPIGQVRMDVAFALTKDDPPNPRLHLVIGPDL